MNRNTNVSSIQRVNRKLKEVLRFSRAKQRKGNVKKCAARAKLVFLLIRQNSVLHVQSCFLLIRSIVVFYSSCCFQLAFSVTQVYIIFEESINIKKSFAFSAG